MLNFSTQIFISFEIHCISRFVLVSLSRFNTFLIVCYKPIRKMHLYVYTTRSSFLIFRDYFLISHNHFKMFCLWIHIFSIHECEYNSIIIKISNVFGNDMTQNLCKNLKIIEYELYGFYNSYSIPISTLYLYYVLVSALFSSYDVMVYHYLNIKKFQKKKNLVCNRI